MTGTVVVTLSAAAKPDGSLIRRVAVPHSLPPSIPSIAKLSSVPALVTGFQNEFLYSPIQQFAHVELVF